MSLALSALPFVQARYFHYGRVAPIKYIVLHCTATDERNTFARAIASNFAAPDSRVASAHVAVDANEGVRSVQDWDTAWAAPGFNADGLHVEMIGLASQSRDEWLDDTSKKIMANAASVVKQWSALHGVDVSRFRSIDELRAGTGGLTTHLDCDTAFPSTGHTDPGPNFPRDVFLEMLNGVKVQPLPPGIHRNPYPKPDFVKYPVKEGGVGSPVQWVQWALQLDPNGRFDAHLTAAVKAAQKRWKVTPVDGIVGPTTGELFTRFLHK